MALLLETTEQLQSGKKQPARYLDKKITYYVFVESVEFEEKKRSFAVLREILLDDSGQPIDDGTGKPKLGDAVGYTVPRVVSKTVFIGGYYKIATMGSTQVSSKVSKLEKLNVVAAD